MVPGRFLFFAFVSLLIQVRVNAAEEYDYSLLNNAQGKTPCEMKSNIESCTGTLKARNVPSPTNCTCTNVYFNVWSACLLSNGTAESTVLSSNWTATCEQQGLNLVDDSYSPSNSLDLPSWAFMMMPSNQTFNVVQALNVAIGNSGDKWSKVQVIVPIVVGIVVTAAFIIGILIWRSKKSGSASILTRMQVVIARVFRDGFGTSRIRAGRRDQEWVIDRPPAAELEMLSNATPIPKHLHGDPDQDTFGYPLLPQALIWIS
ncbi:hypothetical protein BT96DRAFT_998297 [Gymnopus androsaceus JB14]|uniref:Extracellular membrane protein CFEM domain-containing protein n=1 Tax=Gymnopus androsaceus JB14 TaxID=1447944 RepID=A0A6A4HBM8_9AGAR|nr:hypothetical protein BT96DRAFT_998297 [Gymnopus androsaceus JB14]